MSARLVYVGPHDEVEIAATGQVVARGAEVDVGDAALAERLLEQPDNWARPGANAKAAKATAEVS